MFPMLFIPKKKKANNIFIKFTSQYTLLQIHLQYFFQIKKTEHYGELKSI